MRNSTTSAIATTLLVLFANAAVAATEVRATEGRQTLGTVSVSGASDLDDAVSALSAKADQFGATHFKITSVRGKNNLSATAVLLK